MKTKKKMGYSLSPKACKKIDKLREIYNFPNASQTVEACINQMFTPEETKMFNDLIQGTTANLAKIQAIMARRLNIAAHLQGRITELETAGRISKEAASELHEILSGYATRADVNIDAFLIQMADMHKGLQEMMPTEAMN